MMKRRLIPFFILLLLLEPMSQAMAAEAKFATAFEHFQHGEYLEALEDSKDENPDAKQELARRYLRAMSQARLQDFAEALNSYFSVRSFQRAHAELPLPIDFFYEEGQAFYATKNFAKARVCFLQSIGVNYRVATSHYYAGFISVLLEESEEALKHFKAILAMPTDSEKIKQAAFFQIAEVEYGSASKMNQSGPKFHYLLDVVLPSYQRVIDFDPKSELANGALVRVNEVETKSLEYAPKMRNGNPIPLKPFAIHFAEDIGWDSNVATIADESGFDISHKATFFVKPTIFAKYQLNWRDTWSLIPEASFDRTFYTQRDTPQIYQNDNENIFAALRGRYEHSAWSHPATGLLDFEYTLMLRDYQKMHELLFYTRTYDFAVGERFHFFDLGGTTVKFHFQIYQSEDGDRTATIPSVSVSQSSVLLHRWDWENSFSADYVQANNQTYDEHNYRYRSSLYIPKITGQWDLAPALALSVKDTMRLRPSRGIELDVNPTLDFSRRLSKQLGLHFLYAYTYYYSKDKVNYLYSEHVLTSSLQEDF